MQERIYFGWCGRQAYEIEAQSTNEGFFRRFFIGVERCASKSLLNERIDGMLSSVCLRNLGPLWCDKCPVPFILRPFDEPLLQEGTLFVTERFAETWRGHLDVGVERANACPKFTLLWIGGVEYGPRVPTFQSCRGIIEAQSPFDLLLIGTMALETVIRKDGADVAIERYVRSG